ncbi:hypothetical protein ACFWJY_01495 [Streptomyces anulatus]|uniref:hypothetical protein n=1 Tax=Streptomyces anulatus TaxID=1892 RepID=UPI00365F8E9D
MATPSRRSELQQLLTWPTQVVALPDPQCGTPRALGVEGFAIRRGQTCSTVLTSVDDHRAVDLLPARRVGPLATRLIRHPGLEIMCRGRASARAEGARRGGPMICGRFVPL